MGEWHKLYTIRGAQVDFSRRVYIMSVCDHVLVFACVCMHVCVLIHMNRRLY